MSNEARDIIAHALCPRYPAWDDAEGILHALADAGYVVSKTERQYSIGYRHESGSIVHVVTQPGPNVDVDGMRRYADGLNAEKKLVTYLVVCRDVMRGGFSEWRELEGAENV